MMTRLSASSSRRLSIRLWDNLDLAEVGRVAAIFIVSRLALVAVGLLANRYVPGLYGPEWQRLDKPLLDMWYRWDAGFYTAIGTYGYNFAVNHTAASDIAFMPLYPSLIRLVNPLIGCVDQLCIINRLGLCAGRECALVSGLAISNLALLSSGVLLYDLVKRLVSAQVAMRSVWLLMLAPDSIFFSGVYTESLFLFLALITFQALSRSSFWVAIIAASLACLTREVGLALYPALIVYAWNQTGRVRSGYLIGAQLAPLAFAAYVIGAGLIAGHGLAYFEVNRQVWGVSLGNNALGSFGPYFPPYDQKEFVSLWGAGPAWLNLASALFYLLLTIPAFKQQPSFGLFGLVAILIPIAGGTLVSMPRFGGVIFPFYSVGGEWADTRWKQAGLVAAFALAAVFFAVRFVTWHWTS